ncbi:ABC transporter permease [Pseudomonas sp. 5P_3.1_Bac2]|uniref:ABC transporter permease n=1 Tax=Pseudomonas sp. 5P_3.1_Bac2 TaxID=2971617 RepID=UPI0021C5ACA1|nr:ABC transporter permease subunit [Pseudomonas sp. 5P_3.1_Bac2]MCU1719144.1 ABC transporter permease subunit [Pseudomonas sp. 5P_3.1_Bac2]
MRFLNRYPGRGGRVLLALLPLLLLVLVYGTTSTLRLADNPADRLLPSLAQMGEAVGRLGFTEDPRSGEYLLWRDTGASLLRLGLGLAIAAAASLVLGIAAGVFPLLRAPLSPLLAVLSMVPPLAILPILFIVFGLAELSKVMLIVIGITPCLARDLEQRAREIPAELLIKAQTLGANSWTLVLRVVLPQLLARLLVSLRLMLGSAWLFLISAEAISATEGLGYRIFLVRRYMAMDVILPYVLWITLLAWLMDWGLRLLHRRLFPWSEGARP